MRPTEIPEELIPAYAKHVTIGPPPGDEEDVSEVDALMFITSLPSGSISPAVTVRVGITKEDLEYWAEQIDLYGQAWTWLTFISPRIVPFMFEHELPEVDEEMIDTLQGELPDPVPTEHPEEN